MNTITGIATVITPIASWLLIASVKTTPLILALLLLQRLLRKQVSATARHLLWISVLISLSIPFGWQLHIERNMDAQIPIDMAIIEEATPTIALTAPAKLDGAATPMQAALPTDAQHVELTNLPPYWQWGLAFSWLGMAFLLTVLTLKRAFYFQQIKANAQPADKQLNQLFAQCKTEMGVTNAIALLHSNAAQSPITVGWLRPAVILPANTEAFTSDKLKHILLHELGHIKRQDILFNWLACIINILHWFNPIVWLACRRMRMDMEMACDALVLSHLHQSQRKNYGATLIDISNIAQASGRTASTVGILENHKELKERLTMIKEFTTMNMKSTLIFSSLLLATAATAFAQPALQKPPSTATEATSFKAAATSGISLREVAERAEQDLKTKVLVGQKDADNHIQVNFGSEKIDYGQLLTQLKINEYTAYKSKDYIQIIPMRDARSYSIPTVEKGKSYYEDEVVTDYIVTEKICVGGALAATRPLVPQYGHLTAYEPSNTLIISDTYGNIQRIKTVIKSLEANLSAPQNCKALVQQENHPQPK